MADIVERRKLETQTGWLQTQLRWVIPPTPSGDLSLAASAAVRGLAKAQNQSVHRTFALADQWRGREPHELPRCPPLERCAQVHLSGAPFPALCPSRPYRRQALPAK